MKDITQEGNEKRGSPRNPADIEIAVQPYSSTGSIRHSTGIVRNYSKGGIYIETSYAYSPGTILFIRTTHGKRPSLLDCGEGLRTICLAEVKWQHDLSDPKTSWHGMGLRYLD